MATTRWNRLLGGDLFLGISSPLYSGENRSVVVKFKGIYWLLVDQRGEELEPRLDEFSRT